MPALDGLRGVAILLVLLIHFYQKSFIIDAYPVAANILGRVVGAGGYGVELFFVLSGFLITGILLDTRHEPGFFKNFYMRRVLRIFPLYYGALAIVLLVLPHLIQFDQGAENIRKHQIWMWTYLTNWPAAGWIWDNSALFLLGHFWSLSVEEHFYFVWPSLVAVLSRRTLCVLCGGLVCLGLLSRSVSALMGAGAPILFQWTTLQKVDGLAIGALIAIVLRDASLALYLPKKRARERNLLVFGMLFLAYLWLPRKWHLAVFDIAAETIIVCFFGLLLLHVLSINRVQLMYRLLTSKLIVAFGTYSYGIYVIHGILRPMFSRVIDWNSLPQTYGLQFVYLAAYWVMAVGISFGLAYMSYHLFEKQFLKLKRYFQYRNNAPKNAQSECLSPAVVDIKQAIK
jgi:peptidoglycan/LPS O-acetylase OafA/YrhL